MVGHFSGPAIFRHMVFLFRFYPVTSRYICLRILWLQLLPMVGVTLGEDPTSLVGRLQHSSPAVKQINSEFQDAVSQSFSATT